MKLTIKDIKTAKVFDVEIAAEPVSVEVLKMAIQASQHIEVANQKLVYKGKTLREGVKLGDVGVENGATVHLVLKLASALGAAPAAADPDRFTLNIKNLKTRTTFAVELGADPTVAQVKEAIAAHMPDVAPDHQRLVFGGKSLADGALRDAGVASGQTVHLVLRLKTTVELRVRVMSGAELTWDTAKTASVDDALAAVHELLNLDARPRVLCVDGRPLDAAGAIDQHGPLAHRQLLHLVLAPAPGADSLYDHLGAGADADAARCYGLAGSLYARCGGIFGVASFVDACMDAWMAEPTLNANAAVATWHGRAQRCGFKFLVTQLISYQCGGPQVYTGREMAASHKHLSISPEEWDAFMTALDAVCGEFKLPDDDRSDLRAVVASMRADCTLGDGEAAPPNPGHPPPPGRSLYARLGGACLHISPARALFSPVLTAPTGSSPRALARRRLPDLALCRPARRRAAQRPHRQAAARREAHARRAQVRAARRRLLARAARRAEWLSRRESTFARAALAGTCSPSCSATARAGPRR